MAWARRAAGALLLGVPAATLAAAQLYHERRRPRLPACAFVPAERLARRTAVVTGATSGIGRAAALGLARRGVGRIVIGSRDPARGEEARALLVAAGARDVHALELDMSDLHSVKAFGAAARQLSGGSGGIDLVVSAAAEIHMDPATSNDGVDATFATNHLGLHALLRHLEPALVRSSSPGRDVRERRVVIVGSRLEAKGAGILSERFETLQATQGARLHPNLVDAGNTENSAPGLSPMDHYAATKHANMLLAQHLYDKWRGSGPRVFVVTPGMVDSNLWRNFPLWYRIVTYPLRRVALRTPDEAALGVVWAALSVEAGEMEQAYSTVEGKGYAYTSDGVWIEPSPAARDREWACQFCDFCDALMRTS